MLSPPCVRTYSQPGRKTFALLAVSPSSFLAAGMCTVSACVCVWVCVGGCAAMACWMRWRLSADSHSKSTLTHSSRNRIDATHLSRREGGIVRGFYFAIQYETNACILPRMNTCSYFGMGNMPHCFKNKETFEKKNFLCAIFQGSLSVQEHQQTELSEIMRGLSFNPS